MGPTPTETAVTKTTAGKKRGRNVRFAEETVTESIDAAATGTIPVQQQWWTRDELKTTQRSFVFAVKRQELGMRQAKQEDEQQADEYDSLLLDGSSSRCRKRRKTVRTQVISTIAAVRDYEVVTQTETPSEMLSQLLERYTAPSVFEASQRAKALEKVTTVVAPKTVTG